MIFFETRKLISGLPASNDFKAIALKQDQLDNVAYRIGNWLNSKKNAAKHQEFNTSQSERQTASYPNESTSRHSHESMRLRSDSER